jgi:hypothetical protein
VAITRDLQGVEGKKVSASMLRIFEMCMDICLYNVILTCLYSYCPSRFILGPGEFLHINKGRLHAFRKLSTEDLPPDDCHRALRKALLRSTFGKIPNLTLSVAWDWSYLGYDAPGINREVLYTLESSALNQQNQRTSLAVAQLALLKWVRKYMQDGSGKRSALYSFHANQAPSTDNLSTPSQEHLAGLYPAVERVLQNQMEMINFAHQQADSNAGVHNLDIAKYVDKYDLAVDPYDCDFFCKLCSQELANAYFHCQGCEELIDKDFNICFECFRSGAYKNFHDMHPHKNVPVSSTTHHTGNHCGNADCSHDLPCSVCSHCTSCSCTCHRHFVLRCRFLDEDELNEMAKFWKDQEDSMSTFVVDYETSKARLSVMADRGGVGIETRKALLQKIGAVVANVPNNDNDIVFVYDDSSRESSGLHVDEAPHVGSQVYHARGDDNAEPSDIVSDDAEAVCTPQEDTRSGLLDGRFDDTTADSSEGSDHMHYRTDLYQVPISASSSGSASAFLPSLALASEPAGDPLYHPALN